jgi:hypothetical protein
MSPFNLRATNVGKRVSKALTEYQNGDFGEAMLHTCIAVAATAWREDKKARDKKAFEGFLHRNLDFVVQGGLCRNLAPKSFLVPAPQGTHGADKEGWGPLEAVLYRLIRCSLVHRSELPANVEFSMPSDPKVLWEFQSTRERIVLPRHMILGLILAVVGSSANAYERCPEEWEIGGFLVNSLWAKADVLRKLIAARPLQEGGVIKMGGPIVFYKP